MWEERKFKANYSGGVSEDIITGPDHYLINSSTPQKERRRHPRIPCRNVKACICAGQSTTVVDVLNVSRGGLFFTSIQQFNPGTPVSIAMHYVEGGQNMFQNCRIVRAQPTLSGAQPDRFAAEFGPR